jgi:hypothetical protein
MLPCQGLQCCDACLSVAGTCGRMQVVCSAACQWLTQALGWALTAMFCVWPPEVACCLGNELLCTSSGMWV